MGVGDQLSIRVFNIDGSAGDRHLAQPYMHRAQILMEQTREQIRLSALGLTTFELKRILDDGTILKTLKVGLQEIIEIYLVPPVSVEKEKEELELQPCPLAYAVYLGFDHGGYNGMIQEGRGYLFVNWEINPVRFLLASKVRESYPIYTIGFPANDLAIVQGSDITENGLRTIVDEYNITSPWYDKHNVLTYTSTYGVYNEYYFTQYNISTNYIPSPTLANSRKTGQYIAADANSFFKNDKAEIFYGNIVNYSAFTDTLDVVAKTNVGSISSTQGSSVYANGRIVMSAIENYSNRWDGQVYAYNGYKYLGIIDNEEYVYGVEGTFWPYNYVTGTQLYIHHVIAHQYIETKATPKDGYVYVEPTYGNSFNYWGGLVQHWADTTIHTELISTFVGQQMQNDNYVRTATDIVVTGAIDETARYLTDPYTTARKYVSITSFYYLAKSKKWKSKTYAVSNITSPSSDSGDTGVNPPPGFLIIKFGKKTYYAVPTLYSMKVK
jgi:hypothetical protein